jgi:hypothetical protein
MLYSGKEFIRIGQCPKTLWRTEFKGDGLINLAEEI